jgi:hypothetical protein
MMRGQQVTPSLKADYLKFSLIGNVLPYVLVASSEWGMANHNLYIANSLDITKPAGSGHPYPLLSVDLINGGQSEPETRSAQHDFAYNL